MEGCESTKAGPQTCALYSLQQRTGERALPRASTLHTKPLTKTRCSTEWGPGAALAQTAAQSCLVHPAQGEAGAGSQHVSVAACVSRLRRATRASKGVPSDALVAFPQDAEISAFELQTILRRVLAKRKCPLLAQPSSCSFPCGCGGTWESCPSCVLAAAAEPSCPTPT